jgi:1,4-alpha-glucan branching enzyme
MGFAKSCLDREKLMIPTVSEDQIRQIVFAYHYDPFQVLGAHKVEVGGRTMVAIRAFLPEAREAFVVDDAGQEYALVRIHDHGLFEAVFEREDIFAYQLKIRDHYGNETITPDPYAFLPLLSDFDLQLLGEGNHYQSYEKLGAHLMTVNGVEGVHFAVWAPNAKRVSVIGDFNRWDGRRHPTRVLGGSGIWELFVPGLGEGTLYKFEIKGQFDQIFEKTDPHGYAAELRPRTASVVWDIDKHRWGDQEWMERRASTNYLQEPMSIYEVHLGSWMRVPEEGERFLTYRELAHQLVDYVKEMGYTHIELLPIMEHPLDASWGYQIINYFAPTSRFGKPDDLQYFVDHCHQNGIGVIVDWVPAHFPRDAHGLARFDGSALYEHEDPRKGEHKDWGTLIFNYGRGEVRNFLICSGLFWLDKYHIDGLRVDAVASMLYLDYSREAGEWVPNVYGGNENLEAIDFLKKFNELTHQNHPGAVTIAEESTAYTGVSRPTYLGGLGFTFKWNMGWMNDTLRYIEKDPIHRKYHHNDLTFGLIYAFTENFILVVSHDEVVHGKRALAAKMPGDHWQKLANLRAYLGFMFTQPGKKLLFMGADIAQWDEWSEARSLDWHLLQWEPHQKLQRYVADLNRLYRSEPALYQVDHSHEGFEWIDFHDWERSVIAYLRKARDPSDYMVVVCNFTPVPREGYRVGVPEHCHYVELFNSDAEIYWGSNMGNRGGFLSDPIPWQGRPCSLNLTLPPLAVCVFKPLRE